MMRRLQVVGAALVLAAAAVALHAIAQTPPSSEVRFSLLLPIEIEVGSDAGLQAVTLADLDRDGRLDLVAINREEEIFEGAVSLALGRGDGTFGAVQYFGEVAGFPTAVTVADVSSPVASTAAGDIDGNPDIIAVDDFGEVSVWVGRGDGTFEPGEQDFVDIEWGDFEPLWAAGVVAVDFDRDDGRADLALLDIEENGVFFLCNNRGLFEPCPTEFVEIQAADLIAIDAGDFDGDGQVDFVVLSQTEGTVALIRGLGGGRFAEPETFEATAAALQESSALAVGRVDGDSFDDVVVVNFEDRGRPGTVVLYGAAGGFRSQNFAVPSFSRAVGLADFSGDGALDAVTSRQSFGDDFTGAGFLLGDGAGGFSDAFAATGTEGLGDTIAVAVGRLDGDALPDFIALSSSGQQMQVALNVSDGRPTPTPGTPPTPVTPVTASPTVTPSVTATRTATATARPTRTPGGFEPVPSYLRCDVGSASLGTTGGRLVGGTTADLNNDRSPDLVLADDTGNRLAILITNTALFANGSCPEAVSPRLIQVAGPKSVAAALLNADRNMDLASARRGGVTVFNGDGSGAFAPGFADVTSGPVAIAAADLDGDSIIDLVVGNEAGNDAVVFFGQRNVDPPFRRGPSLPAGRPVTAVGAANFDGAGGLDIAVLNDIGTVTVFLQTAPGVFGSSESFAVGGVAEDMRVAFNDPSTGRFDFNGDGVPDLAFVTRGESGAQGELVVFLGSRTSSPRPIDFPDNLRFRIAAGAAPTALEIGDFNNDDRFDVVVADAVALASAVEGQVRFFVGNGTGVLEHDPDGDRRTGPRPSAVLAADLDGDARLDVITMSELDASITILLSSNPAPTPTFTSTDTPTATPTVTDTPTQTPTATPTDTPTATATFTVTRTLVPSRTTTPAPTKTPGLFEVMGSSCSIVPAGGSGSPFALLVLPAWIVLRRLRGRA